MDQFASLYSIFVDEKDKLCNNFDKIGETLLDGINSFDTTIPDNRAMKRKEIKTGIVSSIHKLFDLNYEAECLHADLIKKNLSMLLQDTQPERGERLLDLNNVRNNTSLNNPFLNLSESQHTEGLPQAEVVEEIAQDKQLEYDSVEIRDCQEEQQRNVGSAFETPTNRRISDACPEATNNDERQITPNNFTLVDGENSRTNSEAAHSSAASPVIDKKNKNLENAPQQSQTIVVPTPPEKQTKYVGSAIEKLSNRRIPDRYKEATKKYERQIIPDDFTLVEVATSGSTYQTAQSFGVCPIKEKKNKKPYRKYPIYHIDDEILKVGDECCFCYIKDPGEFYVRKNTISFQQFEETFTDEIHNESFSVIKNYGSKAEAEACVGNFCYAFVSEKWYRVQVLDWKSRDDNVPVYLIDYGRNDSVHYRYLRIMHETVTKFPKLAIKCHFASLLSPRKKMWPLNSVKKLEELSGIKQNKKVTTCYVYKEGDSYAVDLVSDESDLTIGELLVESGAALQETLEYQPLIDVPDEELQDFDNINEAISGYDAQDEARICPFTNVNGTCFKGPRCKLEHVQISSDGITTDKLLSFSRAFTDLPIPPVGTKINILPSAYKSTNNFYAHIITDRTKSNAYNDNFQNLVDALKCKKTIGSFEVFKCFPSPGEILLVLHCGEWFRGMCRGPAETPDNFEIFLVDYGLVISKKLSELRQIKEDLLHIPFQAVECVLYNCVQKSNADSNKASDFFLNFMSFKTFPAEIISDDDPVVIKMFDSKGIDFGVVLMQYGLAEPRPLEDYNPPKGCVLQLR